MAGTITWRVQLAGADQARTDFKSLGEAGAAAARSTADGWSGAGEQTEAQIALTARLKDAWRDAGDQRRQYAADLRTSGTSPPQTTLQSQQVQASSVAAAAQARYNALAGVNVGSTGAARDSAAAFAAQLAAMEAMQARANSLRASLSPLVAAQQSYGKAVEGAGELLAAGVITEAEHATAVGVARKALEDAEKAALTAGSGFHLSAAQAMELEHSVRAIGDAIAAGQSPVRAFGLELGRLFQVAGQGEGGAASAFTMLKSVVLGPIGAIGALSVAFIAAAAAEQSYAAAQGQLERYLMGAGREAGVTAEQLEALTEKAAAAGNVSVAAAREMATTFLQTGQIGVQVIPQLIALQRDYAAATGVDAKAATQELAKAMADPARGADDLNKSLHFLDDQQREHIRLLAESGERTQAQEELTRQLTGAIGPASEKLTALGQSLHEVAKAFSDAWTESGKFFYNLTHVPTAADGVAAIQARMRDVQGQLAAVQFSEGGQIAAGQLREELADLQKSLAEAQRKPGPHSGLTPAQNEVSTRAGDAVRALDPTFDEKLRLQAFYNQIKAQADQGFAGMTKEMVDAARRQLAALPRQIASMKTPAEREIEEAADRAIIAGRPGSKTRGEAQADLASLRVAGGNYTPDEANAIIASGRLQGENRGARVDQAGARRDEAEANREAAAAKASADLVARAREAQDKAEETIASARGDQAKSALAAAAADANLSDGERRSRMAQAASDLALQNAKGDRLRLELQRIEEERRRQLNDVAKQKDFTPDERESASSAINASADAQVRAARAQDAAKSADAEAAAKVLAGQFEAAALKARAGDTSLPAAQRVAAEQRLLALQDAEAQHRTALVTSVTGVQAATASQAHQAQADSQAAELAAAVSGQARQMQQSQLESAKALATTQAERNAIEREQLAIAQQQRDAATKILLGQLASASYMSQAERTRLSGALTTAQGNLDASEQEALRRQQLSPLGKLYDASQQASPHDVAEQDLADTSQRLSSAFVALEQNTTTFGKAVKDVITSLQGEVYKQLTDRMLAPAYRFIDQGVDKLLPATASTGVSAAQGAMAQAASAATVALQALTNAATGAATRFGLSGAPGGGLGFNMLGASSDDGINIGSLQAAGQWADIDSLPPFAGGGLFRGPGSPTSDAATARISDGEYIVNARATAQHLPALEAINAGRLPGFASGGYYGDAIDRHRRTISAVDASLPASSGGGSGGGDVHIHNQTGVPAKATTNRAPNGDMLISLVPEGKAFMKGYMADANGFARDVRNIPKTLKTRVR